MDLPCVAGPVLFGSALVRLSAQEFCSAYLRSFCQVQSQAVLLPLGLLERVPEDGLVIVRDLELSPLLSQVSRQVGPALLQLFSPAAWDRIEYQCSLFSLIQSRVSDKESCWIRSYFMAFRIRIRIRNTKTDQGS